MKIDVTGKTTMADIERIGDARQTVVDLAGFDYSQSLTGEIVNAVEYLTQRTIETTARKVDE